MNLLELLRSQARKYRCPVCGQNMADCGINILTQQGNRALVRVTCSACNDENLLQIILQTEVAGEAERPVPTIDEGIPAKAVEPIEPDELLDLHSFLDGYHGDFKTLVADEA